MIPRWRPLPSLVGLDSRARAASHHARGVWLLLVCAADTDGMIPVALTPEATLDAVAGHGAADALAELTALGLVESTEAAVIVPDVPRWQTEAGLRSMPRQTLQEPAQDAPELPEVPAVTLDRREAAKRLGARWSEKGLKTPADRARWLSSETGRRYLDRAGIAADLALSIAGVTEAVTAVTAGVTGVTEAVTAVTGSVTAGVTEAVTAPPPSHSPSEKRAEEKREEGGNARHGRVTEAVTGSVTAGVTDVTEAAARDFLRVTEAESGGGLLLSGSAAECETVARVLRASGLSAKALGEALQRPGEVWPTWVRVRSRGMVTASLLAANDGEAAHELVAWVKGRAAPAASPSSAVPGVEETAARIARQREAAQRALEERKGVPLPAFRPRVVNNSELTSG